VCEYGTPHQKRKLHFHVPAFPVPTVSVRHCVACVAFIALSYNKYVNLYKTLGWKKWLGVTAVATPALVNVAATSPVLNKAPLGSTLGNGTPLKYTVVYLYLPCCKASL
jgi:hypothetical protein